MSPVSERAQKARALLAGKAWAMRPVRVMRAWICRSWRMLEQDSMATRVGFVMTTLVGGFHLDLSVESDADENVLRG